MKSPVVSIVCITYNHESFIRDCLEGFIMQKTNFAFEVLIHDDASTDKTADIIRLYEAKFPEIIKPIYQIDNQYSKGINPGTKFLFPLARGKYIAICEGDDYWTDPLKLQKQVDFLEANDKVMAISTNSSVCDLNGNTLQREKVVIPPDNKEGIYNLHDFFGKGFQYSTNTVVFRNQNMDFIAKESKRMSNPFLGDWILWVLLHLQGDFYFINIVTAAYRMNPNSLTHTVNPVKRWEWDFLIRSQLNEVLPKEYHKYLKDSW